MYRRHLVAFVSINALLTAINAYYGPPWWSVWPLMIWGLVVMVHFLVYRAKTVNDAWAEERSIELRAKSYDLSHIEDIRQGALASQDVPPPSTGANH